MWSAPAGLQREEPVCAGGRTHGIRHQADVRFGQASKIAETCTQHEQCLEFPIPNTWGQNGETMREALVFATLGPEETNHAYVTRRYTACHELNARLELVADFEIGLDAMLGGRVDYLVQCAAHPAVSRTVARNYRQVFLIDAFVAASQPMALLVRSDVQNPRTLALQPATRAYVDASRWAAVSEYRTVIEVGEALLSGLADAGVTLLSFAQKYPQSLHIDQYIGAMTDGWLVYGKTPLTQGALQCWRDGPASRLYQAARP